MRALAPGVLEKLRMKRMSNMILYASELVMMGEGKGGAGITRLIIQPGFCSIIGIWNAEASDDGSLVLVAQTIKEGGEWPVQCWMKLLV
jgi:hypothetical protein